MKTLPVLAFAAAAIVSAHAEDTLDAGLMRMPAVSEKNIAFVYAGDIWIAPKEGGTALRLSSPRGEESWPRFSPNGREVAFSGNYEGNEDIYVMPVSGGEPRRVTYHGGGDRLISWWPDGKSLMFASRRESFSERVGQFYKINSQGGKAERLAIPYGELGAVSPDGKVVAYTMTDTDRASWKRYRGGMAPDVWLFNLETGAAENVTANDACDSAPMWANGTKLYFLSDRDAAKRANLWCYDTAAKSLRQVTHYTEFDVRFPSMGPKEIVFENGGALVLLDLATEKTREVTVDVITDRATLRPRLENVSTRVSNATISPTGKRVLFEARGDIFSAPAENGVVRNVTETQGIAERYPAWSPDGKWLAYFSDKSGEYELTLRPADGKGEEKQVTAMGPGWRYQPYWSPDSKKLVFIDSAMKIWLHDLDPQSTTLVTQQKWMYHGDLDRFRVSWSSDSAWFAYAGDTDSQQSVVVLYNVKEKKNNVVTSAYYDDDMPVFDPAGNYLFYRSKRMFQPHYSDFDNTWAYVNGQSIICVPLRKDTPSPLAPKNDEEPAPKKDEPKKDAPKSTDPDKKGEAPKKAAFAGVWRGKLDNRYEVIFKVGHREEKVRGIMSFRGSDFPFEGEFNSAERKATLAVKAANAAISVTLFVEGEQMKGDFDDGKRKLNIACTREATAQPKPDEAPAPNVDLSKALKEELEKRDAQAEKKQAAAATTPAGTWNGTVQFPDGDKPFSLKLELNGNAVKGTFSAGPMTGDVTGTFDPEKKTFDGIGKPKEGPEAKVLGNLDGDSMTGSVTILGMTASFKATREKPVEVAAATAPAPKAEEKKPEEKKGLKIDLDGFEARAIVIPVGSGSIDQLGALPGKVLFRWPPRKGSNNNTSPLSMYDLDSRSESQVVDNIGGYEISGDGKKMLINRAGAWSITSAGPSAGAGKNVNVTLEMTVDPVAEWKQMFDDAWRIERDYFYDPHLHMVAWQQMRERYGKMLAGCVSRHDVNYVLGELLGELNSSHAYRSGGDLDGGLSRSVGYLGCDYELKDGAYRISKIHDVAPWDTGVRSPLRGPGITIKEGDFILAVNSRKIDATQELYAAFQGLADKPVILSVNDKPTLEGAKEILIQTIGSESALRHYAWIEQNRRRVDEATKGRVGYIYVKSTAVDGQTELYRQWRAQTHKDGLIIDERWNSGGQIPDRFIELLNRPVMAHWGVRDGRDWTTPFVPTPQAKVMMANRWSGSGGDCFPWLFQQKKLGPVIGTRTWGGLIGMTGCPSLIDGGSVTVPTFSIYDNTGKWIIEGYGVDPDIEVIDDPAQLAKGIDPQLERSITEINAILEKHPVVQPRKPTYQDRTK